MQYRKKYRIESARMPGWDYSTPGYYFVTVCTHDHRHLFGTVVDHEMICNEFGTIVQNEWEKTGAINKHIVLDTFVVMPNHFHAIIQILPKIGHPAGNDYPESASENENPKNIATPRTDVARNVSTTLENENPKNIATPRTDVARNVSTLNNAIIDNTEIIAASTPENENPNPIATPRTDVARNVSTLNNAIIDNTENIAASKPENENPNPIATTRTDVARNVCTLNNAIIDNTENIAASTPENENPEIIATPRTDVARNVSTTPENAYSTPPKNQQMAAISPPRGSLPAIMRSLKSAICKQINEIRNTPGAPVLQFRFHDHIIRNEQELFRIRHYIRNNPRKWRKDTFNAQDDFSVRETENDDDQEIWMI